MSQVGFPFVRDERTNQKIEQEGGTKRKMVENLKADGRLSNLEKNGKLVAYFLGKEVEKLMDEIRKAGGKFGATREECRAIFEAGGARRKEVFRKLSGADLEAELDFLHARKRVAVENLGKSFVLFSEELVNCLQQKDGRA